MTGVVGDAVVVCEVVVISTEAVGDVAALVTDSTVVEVETLLSW